MENKMFWLKAAEDIAKERFDGHYTLMRFTTNWRFCFGTISDRADIDRMISGATMVDAVMLGVITENNAYEHYKDGGFTDGSNT